MYNFNLAEGISRLIAKNQIILVIVLPSENSSKALVWQSQFFNYILCHFCIGFLENYKELYYRPNSQNNKCSK